MSAEPRTWTRDEVAQLVIDTFVRVGEGEQDFDPHAPALLGPEGAEGIIELCPGTLFRLEAGDVDDMPVWLTVFPGTSGVGGRLWQQQARTLLRLGGKKHSALPMGIRAGLAWPHGDQTREPVGYVTSPAAYGTMADVDRRAEICSQDNRARLFRQVLALADGLRLLHESGVLHRNLCPDAIEIGVPREQFGFEPDAREFRLLLTRFEMSVIADDMLTHVRAATATGEAVAAHQIAQGAATLAYMAPERLAWLMPEGSPDQDTFDHVTSDVFSLGVMAAEWFAEPVAHHVREAPFRDPGRIDWDALETYHRAVAKRLDDADLPEPLRRGIRRMLVQAPKQRSTAAEVVQDLASDFDMIQTQLSGDEKTTRPYVVAVAPNEYRRFKAQGFTLGEPGSTPEATRELLDFIENDLSAAVLEYAPRGYEPLSTGDREEYRQARFVLRGNQVAYFCRLYEDRPPGSTSGTVLPTALMVVATLVLSSPRAKRYTPGLFSRRVPRMHVYPKGSRHVRTRALADRPPWVPLLKQVESDETPTAWSQAVEAALRWFLELQRVEIEARSYAVKVAPLTDLPESRRPSHEDGDRYFVLEHDADRDVARTDGWPLLSLYAASAERRPPFVDFFTTLVDRKLRPIVAWVADDEGQPGRGRDARIGIGEVERHEGERRLLVRKLAGRDSRPPPSIGWLLPDDSFAAHEVLRRQVSGLQGMLDRKDLIEQLRAPTTLPNLDRPWKGTGKKDGLKGKTALSVLEDMLTASSFYALHGPPGTGKTTITAHAIVNSLKRDPSLRILVAAQSHFAVDNMAERIQGLLATRDDLRAVRIVSTSTEDNVRGDARDLLPSRQVAVAQKAVREALQGRLASADPGFPRDLLEQYLANLDAWMPEIADRLQDDANIFFATCAACTPAMLGTDQRFDWVIVEEAAKAWPTELAMPLMLGDRWTLIGDHEQLPPFRKRDVGDMLSACTLSAIPSLRRHGERKTDYMRVFDLFEKLFEAEVPKDRPLATGKLIKQRRMHPTIGDLVSDVFYGGALKHGVPDDADHGLSAPSWLRDPETGHARALIWIDTKGVPDCHQRRLWHNPGEVGVIADLLARLRPLPKAHEERLVVLSPYRAQLERLEQRLDPPYDRQVRTVDAFQGREAEIAIVSLVRSKVLERPPDPEDPDTVIKLLGHTADRARTNVMLSRAKRLLVLVGDFDYFRAALSHDVWAPVCDRVTDLNAKVSAKSLGLGMSREAS